MNKIISVFSSRLASIFSLVIAILSRIINVCFVSYSGRDKMFTVMQSKSLLEGRGFGVPGYLTTNPDQLIYDYTPLWPPGYSALLAPFLRIFNYDIYWATTAFDIVVCIALIFVARRVCRQFGLSTAAINIVTLIVGCFEYPFIFDSKPTDNVSIVIFLFAISVLLDTISKNRFSYWAIFITSFFLFLPFVFRYSYPPLSIAVCFSVLFTGFMKKDALLMKKGGLLLVLTAIFIVFFLGTMKSLTGHVGYAVPTARGYFPEQIIHWFPAIPGSFMYVPLFTSQALKILKMPVPDTMRLLEIFNVIAIISIAIVFLSIFFSKKFLAELTPFKWFFITGFFGTGATFVSLGYLSLTYEAQDWSMGVRWTYINDYRYYAFVILFLQLLFIGWVSLYRSSIRRIPLKIIALTCGLLLFIEVTHNIYFYTKLAFAFDRYKSNVYREQDLVYFFKLIPELEKKYPDHEIWAAAPNDDFFPYVGTYYGHKGIMDPKSFIDNNIKVKQKTILAFVIYDIDLPAYKNFISDSKILFTNRIQSETYYIIELLP